jgi:SAM-dependent methyltransferase
LFASFTDCNLSSADISPYEGAEHVFDICGDVPETLRGQFDFIIDGGSLDNVFDPFRMLANMTEMLRPGGRLFIFAWSNSFPSAYVKITPDWLMDYFAVNEFADAKVYPVLFPTLRNRTAAGITVFQYDPHVINGGNTGYQAASIHSERPLQTNCIAEKGADSTSHRAAVQTYYRGDQREPYLTSMSRFRESPRPIFKSPHSIKMTAALISDFDTIKPIAYMNLPDEIWPKPTLAEKREQGWRRRTGGRLRALLKRH